MPAVRPRRPFFFLIVVKMIMKAENPSIQMKSLM